MSTLSLSLTMGAVGGPSSLAQRALSAIRRNGGTLLLPGLPRNWLDSVGTIAATVDNPVGLVQDSVGSNHATQPTTASKPILRRGLVNQLLWSSDFSNAAWGKSNAGTGLLPVVTPGAATTPTGQTAALVVLNKGAGTTSTDQSRIHQGVAVTNGQIYTQAFWLRTSDGTTKVLSIRDDFASVVNEPFTVTPEWQLFVRSAAAVNTTSHVSLWLRGTTGSSDSASVHVAAALFNGTVTADQILAAGGIPLTTTAPASSERGNYAWQWDGSNDFLQTGITTGNEGWVCAGVNFQGAAGANETIFANGAGSSAQKGVWLVRIGQSGENIMRMGIGNGTALTMPVVNTLPLQLRNTPRVVEGGWTADSVFVTVDGTTTNTLARTGDAATPPQTTLIGAYLSGIHSLQGSMSATVYTPVLPSAADRALIRRFIGSLQGQQL